MSRDSDEEKSLIMCNTFDSEQLERKKYSATQCILAAIFGSVCAFILMAAVASVLWTKRIDRICQERIEFFCKCEGYRVNIRI